MRFPDELDPGGFLASHWQKKPLFIRSGFDAAMPVLEPDELAWLATLPDVESRLVFTEGTRANARYRVEHGPFEEQRLSELPQSNWTLLVQDVEKHLPDFRQWFECVTFVPDWRIDDLMISFAAPGGSVGPHQDNYDVFLCQGMGRREWRLADPGHTRPSSVASDLSLLEPFDAEQTIDAHEFDVLYLPPGVPHWGIAIDRCMTYSIGMRAPEWPDLISAIERLFPKCQLRHSNAPVREFFYRDPDLQADEAKPGLISANAMRRARSWLGNAGDLSDLQFARVFGSLVTDPKAWLSPERLNADESRDIAGSSGPDELVVHGMTRIAYLPDRDVPAMVFANGFHRAIGSGTIDHIAQLCRQRRLSRVDVAQWRARTPDRELLVWLLGCGVFDPGEQ